MGTVNLLEAVRKADCVRAVVVITSDKCYENNEWPWGYRESDPMGGHDPYSSSKGCAELVASAYRSSFFLRDVQLATARAGNVFGGGDWASDRLIPDVIRACSQQQTVEIRNPNSIRPWQHVLEPLRGYLTLAERLYEAGPPFAEAWNFGPNDEDARPVGDIVRHLCLLWGNDCQWRLSPGTHPHEASYLKLDCAKARSRLSFRPQLSLDSALEWTVEWYRAWCEQADMRVQTEMQISRYQPLEPR
jgi:CDP-glucose 4,6-dehydratase